MSNFLKRILFFIYVFFARRRQLTEDETQNDLPARLVWKDAWFFLWHKFFWSMGRSTIAPLITKVKPLVYDEWSGSEHRDYELFSELASRDNRERELHDKILHTTRYKLAPDTIEALCRFYEHSMLAAPWQYGMEARRRAATQIRNFFLASLVIFIFLCNIDFIPEFYLAWARLIGFLATFTALSGWYVSVRIYHIARETMRIRSKRHAPSL